MVLRPLVLKYNLFQTVPILSDIDYQIAEINVQSSTDYGQKLNVIYFHTIELNISFE